MIGDAEKAILNAKDRSQTFYVINPEHMLDAAEAIK
jgi:hypothetical protein